MEARACGLPVRCSSNGGTKELVQDNGVVIELEEEYTPGTLVDLYNPPDIEVLKVVDGVHRVLDKPIGFSRPDLMIDEVAQKYLDIMTDAV